MKFDEAAKKEKKYYAGVFRRLPVLIVRGEGAYVWDDVGRQYLDFCSGVAVNSVGHCHPKVVRAIIQQAENLIHTSNWFYTEPQLSLAETLVSMTGLEKAFITNSGTEAVESALKLARSATGRAEFVAMEGAFHGRTMGSLAVTSGEKYRKPFEPGVPGAKFVPYNNLEAVKNAVTKNTAAVIVEPIQGESGVIVPDKGYLKGLRDITKDKGALLVVDEIQTGFGRTGSLFAFPEEKIKPDILCLAKAMGGGVAIGATVYAGVDFKAGEHGGTMGGNPLACAAANAAIDVIRREKLHENAGKVGGILMDKIAELGFTPRGRGLMIGVPMQDPRTVAEKLVKKYVLTIHSKDALRILPPLIIEESHVKNFMTAFSEAMGVGPKEEKPKEKLPVSGLNLAASVEKGESRIDPAVIAKIAELLPTTDCGDCGVKSCQKFAEKLLLGGKKLSECPHLTPEQYDEIMLILEDYFH